MAPNNVVEDKEMLQGVISIQNNDDNNGQYHIPTTTAGGHLGNISPGNSDNECVNTEEVSKKRKILLVTPEKPRRDIAYEQGRDDDDDSGDGYSSVARESRDDDGEGELSRQPLFRSSSPNSTTRHKTSAVVSPSPSTRTPPPPEGEELYYTSAPPAKRRLIFGKYTDRKSCASNVSKVYKIVRKLTGSIGGNGYCGPIYGELTMGSMQKMIDLMMKHTDLNQSSRFIDVGSGIGKPNLHVAQYPGVEFSCGVEMEDSRWALGMACLKAVLDEAMNDSTIQGNTMFLHKDIMEADTFDPFTHVYMFSIGFPPPLWDKLSDMWNKSASPYLICYHAPKKIIEKYGFDVKFLAQTQTSMHGSSEGHMGYIYQRNSKPTRIRSRACDKLFQESWDLVRRGLEPLQEEVSQKVKDTIGAKRATRSSSRRN